MTEKQRSQSKPLILFIEDEEAIRDMVRYALELEGFEMAEAGDAVQAERLIEQMTPDLILLDWMLPGKSGIEIAKHIKQDPQTRDIPIILLTARAEEESKIKGLETGADDYITKPFSPRELVARIRTVLRRGPLVSPEGIIQIDKLTINLNTHQVQVEEKIVKLNPIEFQLLRFFAANQNKVFTRDQILNRVWGRHVYVDERTVDVQIRRLRKALSLYGYDHLIETVHGTGYKFVVKS